LSLYICIVLCYVVCFNPFLGGGLCIMINKNMVRNSNVIRENNTYCGKCFLTRQIPTSCLPTMHIEHICTFFVAFSSATIDGRNLIFGHKLHIGVRTTLERLPLYFWTNKYIFIKQDELWANVHLWYPRSLANRK
jgi:hypothetical protein